MRLFSGPIRHLVGSSKMEWRWWVECGDCEEVSLATIGEVSGQYPHRCECGRVVARELIPDWRAEEIVSNKQRLPA